MFRITFSVVCLLGLVAPAYADQPPSTPAQNQPGKRADSAVPPNGIIHPAPDAGGHDKMVTPPNVDPGMAVRPPGTPGGNPDVVPK
ncbi:MAG TPA: hypothetical protein VHX39_13970 [Acetobacteraceae bacterium]|nr:hypothetical protein [Acetobacteraceae bacterium]